MDTERIVLVDSLGQPIGEAAKLASHNADTPIHLAFSSYIFNQKGQLLVTKRADTKKVWGGVWTNSCCGHPAPGEAMTDAVTRRLAYELGLAASDFAEIIPDYSYKTPAYRGIIEHEWCPIYAGFTTADPVPNEVEVSAWKWMNWGEYRAQLMRDTGNVWSWWAKDQLRLLDGNTLITEYVRLCQLRRKQRQ